MKISTVFLFFVETSMKNIAIGIAHNRTEIYIEEC